MEFLFFLLSPLPGQCPSEHSSMSPLGPLQSAPPCNGVGLLHVLDLVLVPLPQVKLH